MTTDTVFLLFTDVVASTELSQSLTVELADVTRREHLSILRQAIAETGGNEVKSLGDGLMVAFTSASSALACAVAMQQGVERGNRDRGRPIGLRVGLSGGEVTFEDDDYFGDPVVEAARLCATCASGQVLATEVVRLTAGRRSRQECRPVGELTLKGLPEPVEAVEVLWEPLDGVETGTSVPLPGRLTVRPGVGVVGRTTELETLSDALKRAVAGGGRQVVLVAGEAGMGKSTLTAEMARSAFGNGAVVLLGRCEEELAAPYQLFAEALAHLVAHASDELLSAHVAEHGSAIAHLVPALSRRRIDLPASKSNDADTERYLLFAAVAGLLSLAARDQPVVLVLEDLHWADKSSLALLRHVVASAEVVPLLVIATYRDTELSRSHPLVSTLGVLRREPGVTRVELSGFGDAEVLSFMESAAGQALDAPGVALAHAVYRETDGNPYFVYEVLRHLSESGAIYQDAGGHWTARSDIDDLDLPTSVREVIGARLARLGDDAARALSLAAVIGRDFDIGLLAAATGRSEDELMDMLDTAAEAALVRELADAPGQFSFRHALIQHTLYQDLGPTRRARAHQRVAVALEDMCNGRPGDRVGELAMHWSKATTPVDVDKALTYACLAAEAAAAELAPEEALGFYTQALELEGRASETDPLVHLDILIGLGTAQRQLGDPSFRNTLLEAGRGALELGDVKRLVAATLANNRGFWSSLGVVDTERVELLRAAVDRLEGDLPDRALLLATLCTESTYDANPDDRHRLAEEAMAIAHRIGDDATIVRVSNLVVGIEPERFDETDALTGEALVRARATGDPVLLFWANAWRGRWALMAGALDQEDGCLQEMASLAEWLHQPILTWYSTFRAATRALVAGDHDEAERLATRALEIGTESGQPDASTVFGAQFMSVSWQRGKAGDLVELIEQTIADNPGVPTFRAALAASLVDAGRLDDARRELVAIEAAGYELPRDATWFSGMTMYAEAIIHCGDERRAGALVERLAPWGRLLSTSTASVEGLVDHYVGGLYAL